MQIFNTDKHRRQTASAQEMQVKYIGHTEIAKEVGIYAGTGKSQMQSFIISLPLHTAKKIALEILAICE